MQTRRPLPGAKMEKNLLMLQSLCPHRAPPITAVEHATILYGIMTGISFGVKLAAVMRTIITRIPIDSCGGDAPTPPAPLTSGIRK